MGEYYDLVMALTKVPTWQLDELAAALSPGRMLQMLAPSGLPMFTQDEARYVRGVQQRL